MNATYKKIVTSIMAGGLMTSMASAPVLAASADALAGTPVTTDATIDTSKKGSISIYKLFDATGLFVEADGTKKEWSNAPLGGIEFTRLQIATVETVNERDASTGAVNVGVYYKLTGNASAANNFKKFCTDSGVTLTPDTTVNGVEYYKPETLENAVKALNANQTNVENWVKANGTAFDKTNDAGLTSADNLDLGLYLIAETDDSTAYINGNNVRTGDDFVSDQPSQYPGATTERDNTEANANQPQNGTTEYNGEMFDRTQGTNTPNEQTVTPNDNTAQVLENITIASKIAPYLISVPMTQVDVDTNSDNTLRGDSGNNDQITSDGAVQTKWMYDIVSYPKNSSTEITKKIIDPDDSDKGADNGQLLRDQDDFQIGDTIKQVIWTGVSPLREGKKHEKYIISDKMSKGLILKTDSIVVKMGDKVSNPETYKPLNDLATTLLKNTDYTVDYTAPTGSAENSTFKITFTDAGLTKLDNLTVDSTVAVYFEGIVRSESAIGTATPANMNQPTLKWQNSNEYNLVNGVRTPTDHEITGNRIYDFTYEIDMTKTGLDQPSRSRFEIYKTTKDEERQKTDGNSITDEQKSKYENAGLGDIVKWIKEEDGVYHVFDNDNDTAGSAVTYVSPRDSDGKLVLKGVDSEVYRFREIQTENGKNLLKSTFDVDIDAQDPGRNGNCTATLTTDGGMTQVDGYWTPSNGTTTDLQAEDGVISFTVDNFKGVVLHTGGAGRGMIYGAGAMMAGVMVAAATAKKRKEDKEIA